MNGPPSRDHALHLVDVTVRHDQHAVLDTVSLTVQAGEHVAIIGPSGAGKTTLLRVVAGFVRPTAGRVGLGDVKWSVADGTFLPPERRLLGMVAQDLALWPHLSAEEHLSFVLRHRGVARAERASLARALLDRVGLGSRARHRPSQLSGGEAQRLALARALAGGSRLLLLDEPLGQLDVDLRRRLAREMADVAAERGTTTLHVTHDTEDAFDLAGQVAVLEEGRLVQLAKPSVLRQSPATAFVASATGYTTVVPPEEVSALREALGLTSDDPRLPHLSDGGTCLSPDDLVSATSGLSAKPLRPRFLTGRWLLEVEAMGQRFFIPMPRTASPEASLHLRLTESSPLARP
jgi:ABC-type Fe3+/spermidine/putrescine transport system ATPase subunit